MRASSETPPCMVPSLNYIPILYKHQPCKGDNYCMFQPVRNNMRYMKGTQFTIAIIITRSPKKNTCAQPRDAESHPRLPGGVHSLSSQSILGGHTSWQPPWVPKLSTPINPCIVGFIKPPLRLGVSTGVLLNFHAICTFFLTKWLNDQKEWCLVWSDCENSTGFCGEIPAEVL